MPFLLLKAPKTPLLLCLFTDIYARRRSFFRLFHRKVPLSKPLAKQLSCSPAGSNSYFWTNFRVLAELSQCSLQLVHVIAIRVLINCIEQQSSYFGKRCNERELSASAGIETQCEQCKNGIGESLICQSHEKWNPER